MLLDRWAGVATRVPSDNTQHIQETNLAIEHIVCHLVEGALFGEHGAGNWVSETRNEVRRGASAGVFPRRAWERETQGSTRRPAVRSAASTHHIPVQHVWREGMPRGKLMERVETGNEKGAQLSVRVQSQMRRCHEEPFSGHGSLSGKSRVLA